MEINKTQLRKQKKRRVAIFAILGIALILLVAGLFVRSWIRMPELPDDPNTFPDQSQGEEPLPNAGHRKEGVYTFLVAGRDVASGSTDTMLLLSYDTKAKTVFGLNLPRDTMMNVSTASKRLNAIYTYNRGKDKDTQVEKGMTALKAAVADLTGITPDFYILVEWKAIGELVDAVGGVEFEVPFAMDYDDPYQDPPLHIHQAAGLRTLSGDDAMQVIRWRKNNGGVGGEGGDIARLSIQQDFLKAVVKQCLKPATLLKLNELVEVFKDNVATDLTVGNILAFAEQAIGMDPEQGVSFATAPMADSFRYGGAALITLDAQGILDIVNPNMNPYNREITLEDLEVVVRGANGRFSVTSGTLCPEINANAAPKPAPKPEPDLPEEPVAPEIPIEPDAPVDPEEPDIPVAPEIPGEGPTEPVDPNGDVPAEPEPPEEGPMVPTEPIPPEGSEPAPTDPVGSGTGVTEQTQPPEETAEPIPDAGAVVVEPDQPAPDPEEPAA